MKMKNLLHSGFMLFLVQLLFSCSSAEYYRFAPTQQEAYKRVKEKPAATLLPAAAPEAEAVISAAPNLTVSEPEPVLEASRQVSQPLLPENNKAQLTAPAKKEAPATVVLTPQETEAIALAKTRLAHLTKAEKKEFKNNLKGILQAQDSDNTILKVVLAVLLPPLAVFLHEGITNRFWISLLLTILFFIPGVIYALLVVTDSI